MDSAEHGLRAGVDGAVRRDGGRGLAHLAAGRFHAARGPLLLYGAQLLANLAWTPTFFGARAIGPGLVIIVVLDVLVAATLVAFWRRDRIAGLLMVPYLAWCLYATSLNAGILVLN